MKWEQDGADLRRVVDRTGRLVCVAFNDRLAAKIVADHLEFGEGCMGPVTQLVKAINDRATEFGKGGRNDNQDRADARDLARALARLISGESVREAFGLSRDWGISTPIGHAVERLYEAVPQGILAESLSLRREYEKYVAE